MSEYKNLLVQKAIDEIVNIGGYEVYATPSNSYHFYAFIITPSNNLLYLQAGQFFGVTFSLQYKPSAQTGSGCGCSINGNMEGYTGKITKEILVEAENNGLKYARRLGANLYPNGREALKKHWNYNELVKVN